MANRLTNPNIQFFNNLGLSLGGGSIAFYVTGTTTPATTYTNRALSIANPNPIVLDSAGRCGDVWLDPGVTYKAVLSDSTGAVIWTKDPVVDPAANISAALQVTSGSPNGQLAGTAGTVGGLSASMAYDITNNILYVCTTTGSASGAAWTKIASPFTAAESIKTSSPYAVVTADAGTIITANSASAITFNLPTAASFGANNFISFANIGAGLLTVSPNGADKINNQASLALGIRQSAVLYCTGSGWRILARGDNEGIVTLVDGATPALDASAGNLFRLTSTQNPTIAVPTNAVDGMKIIIEFTASGGARTLSLNTGAGGFIFGSDIAALSQTASGKTDAIGCIFNATQNGFRVYSYIKGF